MKRFEFVLRRNFREKGTRMFILFFALLIPSHVWRIFIALILFSGLLPRDIDRGEEETLLTLTFRRWELYIYDFLTGIFVISMAGIFSIALSTAFIARGLELRSFLRTLAAMPYVYSLSVLMSKMAKSPFVLPLVLIFMDEIFWFTLWKFLSPLAQKTPYSLALSFAIFVIVFIVYAKPRFFVKEERAW